MKARKTKSGKWNVCIYTGDQIIDGKRKQFRKSFTASKKSEAIEMALKYQRTHQTGPYNASVALQDAFRAYIEAKSNILSPSTIRGYKATFRTVLEPIKDLKIKDLDTLTVQKWINEESVTKSPKTIKNACGLLNSVCTSVDSAWSVNVTLPKKIPKTYNVPSYEQVMALADASPSKNLKRAILLAAFCSLRRGEICALVPGDVDPSGWIHVRRDVVMDDSGAYVVKDIPKTLESFRDVPVPSFVMDEIKDGLVTFSPNAITTSFERVCKKTGIICRFHDLRHFFASYLHLKGIPDSYIEKFGGWKPGSSVMKEIYCNAMQSEKESQAQRIIDAFTQ